MQSNASPEGEYHGPRGTASQVPDQSITSYSLNCCRDDREAGRGPWTVSPCGVRLRFTGAASRLNAPRPHGAEGARRTEEPRIVDASGWEKMHMLICWPV